TEILPFIRFEVMSCHCAGRKSFSLPKS
ncbi:unnamed protein product, partial [Didymodactylos carnosus]